ncbi:MAG: TonB-dependent receptor, partial [Steroidobacteraceae bacterium]
MQNDMHTAMTDETQSGMRLKAVWKPTENLKVTGSFDYSEIESVEGGIFRNIQPNALAYGFEPYQQQNGDGSVFQFIPGYEAGIQEYLPNQARLTPGRIKKHRYETNLPSYSVQIQRLGILRLDYDFANAMRLVSLSGYLQHVGQGADDVDGTAAPIYGSTSRDWGQTDKTYSQEFQLLAAPDAKYQWIAGLYYMDQDTAFEPNDAYGIVAGGVFGPNLLDYRFINYGFANAQSYAAYAQSTFPLDMLAEGLRLTAGARYTHDAKEYEGGETFTRSPLGQVQTGDFPSQDKTWNDFSIKATVDYKIGDTMLYATYAEGYRAGLYNLSAPQDVLRDGALDPEELKDYEVGSKSDLMEGRVRLNTAFWFYKFDNIQVNRVTSTGGAGSGIAATIQNAASAETYGGEVTVAFAATDRLSLASGITYIHSEYTDFEDANAIDINTSPLYAPNANVVVDASGNELVRSPKWVVTANVDYRMPVADGELQFDVSGYYNDGYFFNSTTDLRQPSYEMVDAFVRYSWNDRWSVKVWGKNLTNKFFYTELQNLVNIVALDGVPRHWGISFAYEM